MSPMLQDPPLVAPPSTTTLARPWLTYATLALIIAAFAALLVVRFHPAISDPDANGYFAQGSLLVQTGKTWFVPESDAQYIGMHWLITPDGKYVSRYPPGLPVLIGVIYATLGYQAAVFVNPALGILCILGMYLLARRLMPAWAALCSAGILAANPTVIQHSLACDSHIAVAFCLIWGTWFLIRWSQSTGLPSAALAGLLLGCIPTIRYPDAIMGLGIIAFILYQMLRRRDGHRWKEVAAMCCGAAIPIIPLLIRNQQVLGAFWRTGYALTNEQTGFSLAYFHAHAMQYVQRLHSDGMGLVLILGLCGMAWMLCTRKTRPLGLMLSLQGILMLLLYMAYYWAPGSGSMTMRFLVPTFACYALAAGWLLSEALANAPAAARIAVPAIVLSVQFLWASSIAIDQTLLLSHQKNVLATVTSHLDQTARRDDLVISTSQLLQHLDYVRHWKLVDMQSARAPGMSIGRFMRTRNEDDPSPMQAQKQKVQSEKWAGMSDRERADAMSAEILRWSGTRTSASTGAGTNATAHDIWYVGPESELKRPVGSLLPGGTFQVVTRVPLPEAPPMPAREGMFGPRSMRQGNPPPQAGPAGGPGGPGDPPPGPGGPPTAFPGRQNRGPGFGGGAGGAAGGGGGGGGPMMNAFAGEREIVIARWTPTQTAN